jgi:hypothetical protein
MILAIASAVATAAAHIAIALLIFPPWNQLVMTGTPKSRADGRSCNQISAGPEARAGAARARRFSG